MSLDFWLFSKNNYNYNMSKDIIVLAPNGRRQTIHCTADTSILQVLEDVCKKQGFQPSDYDLKHHNHILDLTSTIRFSNLPNKATIEMVEAERKREESNVTIGLQLEDGERRTADFPPSTSLYDLIISLAASELKNLPNPYILYMRQEVIGETALRQKTLRMLGLIKGRAILRLLNKADEARQANVSAVYRVPLPENPISHNDNSLKNPINAPGPSNKMLDQVSLIKSLKNKPTIDEINAKPNTTCAMAQNVTTDQNVNKPPTQNEPPCDSVGDSDASNTSMIKENLERRLHIEEEVTFLGAQKAIAFMQPDIIQEDIDDLPDEFYELTIEEVRKLYHDLQQHRILLENTPLIPSAQRDEFDQQASRQKLNEYKNVVVRVQFPDSIILQGIFQPSNTIQDVMNFVKEHLKRPDKEFHIFTTPIKEALDPKKTLSEAKFVPCVHMHFKWLDEDSDQSYLKEEIYSKKTSSDAASLLASKYRAPSRRKIDNSDTSKKQNVPSTSKNSKMPKWFKN